jgi:hypothetical protein
MKTKTLTACLLAMTAASHAVAQPVQWRVEDGGNGHWYGLVPADYSRDWAYLQSGLARQGGHLATITSAAENAFVASHVVINPPGDGSLIGGFSATGHMYASDWSWVTGETWTYSNWVAGGALVPGEHWVYMTDQFHGGAASGVWDDMPWAPWASSAVPTAVIEWDADCNNDGIVDYGQILSGELQDANHNGIPDSSISITQQPADQAVGVDQPVFFVVETTSSPTCTTPITYRWQRRNPLVTDPNTPNAWLDLQDGGGFINTGTASLTILHPTPALATGYRCRLSGGCGCEGAASGTALTNTVNFGVACPADFNADGGVDFQDVEAFFERWENGC